MTLKRSLEQALSHDDDGSGLSRFAEATILKRLWYFDGRFLDAADFRTEQNYLRNLVRLSNQANGHGLVHGFYVKLTGSTLTVSNGLAVNAEGQVVFLPQPVELDIAALISSIVGASTSQQDEPAAASRFVPCPPEVDDDNNGAGITTTARFFVLSAASAEALCGEQESFGHPCVTACGAETDRSFVIEGVVFRVREYHPSRPIPYWNQSQIRGTVASAWFASERASRRNMMSRSLLSERFWCEGASVRSDSEVDLAIFDRVGSATTWIDEWAVRRELCDASPKNYWLNATDMRPWNVFVAQVLQFQCQLAHCTETASNSQYKQDLEHLYDDIAQFATALEEAADDTLLSGFRRLATGLASLKSMALAATNNESQLELCVGDELPPCGWLPVIDNRGACTSAKALMGNGVDLQFFQVRPDYVGHAFHEAQHLDRISLTPNGSGRRDEVDVLIPLDPSDSELDWVFFVRRRPRANIACEVKPEVGFLSTATREDFLRAGLTSLQADEIVKYRDAAGPVRSFEQLKNAQNIGPATVRKLQDYAAQLPFDLRTLEELSQAEYGVELLELLNERSELASQRRRRLAGVVLKRNFGDPIDIDDRGRIGRTHALRRWSWVPEKLEEAGNSDKATDGEAWVIDQLRLTMPSFGREPSWDQLQLEAETERGLFKIAALWLNDKVKGRATRDWRSYYHAPESRAFKSSLNVANALAQLPIMSLITPILPAGPILGAIGIVLLTDGIEAIFVEEPDVELRSESDAH